MPRVSELTSARGIARHWTGRGIAWIYGQGYGWVRDVFTPAVRRLETSREWNDRVLASGGRYCLGDVHDFNHAPLAAIREYRRSLRDWPENGAAWREIGSMLEFMGRNAEATRAMRKAVEIDPEDRYASGDLECAVLYQRTPPFYVKGDSLGRARELIASRRTAAALQLLSSHNSVAASQVRSRAFGMLGDGVSVLREWESIAAATGPVELDSADRFFLPRPLHDDPRWWQVLWRVRRRDDHGSWNLPESSYGHGTLRARIELHLRHHLARTRRDAPALAAIARRHPWFVEARRDWRRLKGKRAPRSVLRT